MNTSFRVRLFGWLAVFLACFEMPTHAGINDVRSQYSFTQNLNAYWSCQPPLTANSFTPSYLLPQMPGGQFNWCLSLPALNNTQSLVLNNWAASNSGAGVNGGGAATRTNRWTIVMDVNPTFAVGTNWLGVLQTNTANNDDGDIFFNSGGGVYLGNTVVGAGQMVADTWQRMAFVCDNNGAGGTCTVTAYRNGVAIGSTTGHALDGRMSIGTAAYLFTDDNGETNACRVGSLSFWTEALSAAQISQIGGVSGALPEISWSGMPASTAMPGLSGKISFGSFTLDLPATGFQLGSANVQLSPGKATVSDEPSYFITGTHSVRIGANGDLVYTGPLIALNGSAQILVNNVRVIPGNVTLSSSGASTSNYRVYLPIGMGVTSSERGRRLKDFCFLGSASLNSKLLPNNGIQDLTATMFGFPAGDIYACLESLPVRYRVSEVNWSPSTGAFNIPNSSFVTFDRAYERACLAEWNNIAGVSGDPRPSNDDVFAFATSINYWIVDTDAHGMAQIREGTQNFANGSATGFTTHFPYGLVMTWLSGGTSYLRYQAGVMTSDSKLYEGLTTSISVSRDGPPSSCGILNGNKSYSFTPPDHWNFTKDGGFHALVTLNGAATARTLEWGPQDYGVFTHKVDTAFASGAVMVPGHVLRASDVPTVSIENRPAALLLSGNGNGTVPNTVIERPGTSAYYDGLADYAGLNLRPTSDSSHSATSRLADTPLSYQLRQRSKYNLRSAGITAIHEAVAQSPAPGQSYPISTTLAGYSVGLSEVRLSFRDTANVDSAINGGFNLPAPAQLTNLAVKNLRFGARGEFLDADFQTSTEMTLNYWGCKIIPHAMHFALPDSACPSPSSSTMVLGAEVKLPALSDQPFQGNIGFKFNGHTSTPADNLVLANGELVGSRLRPPSQMKIKGPGDLSYAFTPHGSGAYLNEYTSSAPPGFVALAGEMNVPFFRDLRVLLNAKSSQLATSASTLEVYAGDSSNFNFWGASDPDPSNTGKIAALPTPTARRTLWDLLSLHLPVTWDNGTRRFKGTAVTDEILLFSMQQRCSSLGPEIAEINFGASVDPLSKYVSVAGLFDALGADTEGLLGSLDGPVKAIIEAALGDMQGVNQLTADTADALLGDSLENSLDSTANNLYNSLRSRYNAIGSTAFRADTSTTSGYFLTAITGVNGQISGLSSAGWAQDVQEKLDDAIAVCDSLDSLVSDATKIANIASAIAGGGNPSTATVTQTLTDLDSSISTLRAQFVNAKLLFNPGQAFQTLLASSLGSNTQIQTWLSAALGPMQQDWVVNIDDPVGDDFFEPQARRDAFIANFKKSIRSGFAGSVTEQNLRVAIESMLSDSLGQLTNAFDNVIQTANVSAQSTLPLPDSPVTTLGDLANVFQGAKMTGYARINGDSLTELRLDGELKLKVPDDMTIQAWFLLRSMDGSMPGDACLAAGGVNTEITVGASAPLSFIGQQANATVEMRVGIGSSGPVSVAGSIAIDGELNMQTIVIRDPQFGVAIGLPEAYVYAKAAGELDAGAFAMSAEVALFFGKTCRLDPIQKVNPNIAELLTKLGVATPSEASPIYGAYAYAYGDFSVLSLIGIPPTCLLDLRLGGGQGYYLFYRPSVATLAGMQFTYGVRGEFLCLLDVGGRLDGYIAGAVSNNNVSLSGMKAAGRMNASVFGEIGIDPFSYDFEKTIRVDVLFDPNASPKMDWDISY